MLVSDDGAAVGFILGSLLMLGVSRARFQSKNDENQWLEDVEGKEALDWVRKQNDRLPVNGNGPLHDRLLKVFDSKEKIPYISKMGSSKFYYNFWQDDQHERGIWRRTTFEQYVGAKNGDSDIWEIVLDLDALNVLENANWVWGGSSLLEAADGQSEPDRAVVYLSRGGGDAEEIREFDLVGKCFVPESEKPFRTPEAKSWACYKDRDTLLISTDFGPGSLTDSGYPRMVKEWKRGTPLESATTVLEGEKTDVRVSGSYIRDRHGIEYQVSVRSTGFYSSQTFVHLVKGLKDRPAVEKFDKPIKIELPDDCQLDYFADQLLIHLRSEWKGHPSGSLLAIPMKYALENDFRDELLEVLFKPSERVVFEGMCKVKSYVIIVTLDNVVSKIRKLKYDYETSKWSQVQDKEEGSGKAQTYSTIECWPVDSKRSNLYWCTSEGYAEPTTYAIADAEKSYLDRKKLRTNPHFFDASDIVVEQFEAESLDGTKVPYFQVAKRAKDSRPRPTLLYGYGGFEISMLPRYQVTTGVFWLESGNVYVCANIRGGGEFGPEYHKAALKEKRHKAYEDFEAVAQDLIRRGVTTPQSLGAMGGSNGGLLMGNMLVRSPHLFGAIVCMVPLLDMKRYHKLLAGASWMAEYGDPSIPSQWAYLKNYSPYHNLHHGKAYPPILFTSSTRDDRVHPGHARKMCKKMMDMGIEHVYSYENIEGGHGGAATNSQRAYMWTLSYQFLNKFLLK